MWVLPIAKSFLPVVILEDRVRSQTVKIQDCHCCRISSLSLCIEIASSDDKPCFSQWRRSHPTTTSTKAIDEAISITLSMSTSHFAYGRWIKGSESGLTAKWCQSGTNQAPDCQHRVSQKLKRRVNSKKKLFFIGREDLFFMFNFVAHPANAFSL